MNIQILLAIYNPDVTYFKLQLLSLNNQSFKEFEVICCDDGSDNKEEIFAICNSTLTDVKWRYLRNHINIGCNKTFEKLVNSSSAQYLAFCDQDDIWSENKLKCLYEMIEKTGASLVYSDLEVINQNGDIIARSVRDVRKRLTHVSGMGLWSRFLRMNSITGCTMLIRSEIAKAAVPFPDEKIYVWDNWISICAAHRGAIAYNPKPLVKYRIHDNNLVGVKKLVGVNDKETYINNKINGEIDSLTFAISRLNLNETELSAAIKLIESVKIRKMFISSPSFSRLYNFLTVSSKDPLLLLLELVLAISPGRGTSMLWLVKRISY